MKKLLLFSILFFGYVGSSLSMGYKNTDVSFYSESRSENTARGINILVTTGPVYYGLSLSEIESDEIIGDIGVKTIHPMYASVGTSLPYFISPYIEAGFDVGDFLLDALFNNPDHGNEFAGDVITESDHDIDTYFAVGVKMTINKTLGASVYYKNYRLRYIDYNLPINNRRGATNMEMSGIGLHYIF